MKVICNKAKEGKCNSLVCMHAIPHDRCNACADECMNELDVFCVPVEYIAS